MFLLQVGRDALLSASPVGGLVPLSSSSPIELCTKGLVALEGGAIVGHARTLISQGVGLMRTMNH